jgi:hypothetical protein
MSLANLRAAVPGVAGFVGSVTLPHLSPAEWAALAGMFSGIMGGLWFGVQILLAVEKRCHERRAEKSDNPSAE